MRNPRLSCDVNLIPPMFAFGWAKSKIVLITIDLYDGQKEFNLDNEDVLYLAGERDIHRLAWLLLTHDVGTLFEAGADTTTSTLISLFLACALDPDVCKKIQAEVDAHTSRNMSRRSHWSYW
jgi:hypothetical protein